MNNNWDWLIGRRLSLGKVIDVAGDTATVRHGDDDRWINVCDLLEEDYKSQDRADRDLSEALNTSDGAYRP